MDQVHVPSAARRQRSVEAVRNMTDGGGRLEQIAAINPLSVVKQIKERHLFMDVDLTYVTLCTSDGMHTRYVCLLFGGNNVHLRNCPVVDHKKLRNLVLLTSRFKTEISVYYNK